MASSHTTTGPRNGNGDKDDDHRSPDLDPDQAPLPTQPEDFPNWQDTPDNDE